MTQDICYLTPRWSLETEPLSTVYPLLETTTYSSQDATQLFHIHICCWLSPVPKIRPWVFIVLHMDITDKPHHINRWLPSLVHFLNQGTVVPRKTGAPFDDEIAQKRSQNNVLYGGISLCDDWFPASGTDHRKAMIF